MTNYDVVVIGGGPAGLAGAISANKNGARVLIIEREERLGGVLKQCIHDGFGVIRFGEKLSGCEYATRYIHQLTDCGIDVMKLTFATAIEKTEDGFLLTLVSHQGMVVIHSKTIIFATGCRERTARQVAIHGDRPAGVLTAGSAQYYINVMGEMPGKNCVILGSGDIGLIMARRLTLEGAKVKGVYEAKPEPSGLMRNIYQCLVDFDIPLHLSETVTQVHGRGRVNGVTVAKVDKNMRPIVATEKCIECDTLILSVGLIPENELCQSIGVKLSKETKGPICNQEYMTNVPGVFACGNCVHVNDLVDYVSESGEIAGKSAANYSMEASEQIQVNWSQDFAYVVPQRLDVDKKLEKAEFFFRTRETRGKTRIKVYMGEREIFTNIYTGLRPPEMEKVVIKLQNEKITIEEPIKFVMEDMENE